MNQCKKSQIPSGCWMWLRSQSETIAKNLHFTLGCSLLKCMMKWLHMVLELDWVIFMDIFSIQYEIKLYRLLTYPVPKTHKIIGIMNTFELNQHS